MRCRHCGKELKKGQKFCPRCGEKVVSGKTKKWKPVAIGIFVVFFAALEITAVFFAGKKIMEKMDSSLPRKAAETVERKEEPEIIQEEKGEPEAESEKEKETEEEKEEYLACVGRMVDGELKCGFINKEGEEVVPAQYDGSYLQKEIADGDIEIQNDNGRYGVRDEGDLLPLDENTGNLIDYVINYDGNGAKYAVPGISKNGKEVMLNRSGEEVNLFSYDYFSTMSVKEPFAVGKETGEGTKWGFINEEGEEVIPLQYDGAWGFVESGLFAQVEKDNKRGFINEEGEEVIPLQYNNVSGYGENGLFWVRKETEKGIYKWGCLNEKEEEVLPFEYDEVVMGYTEGGYTEGECVIYAVGKQTGEDDVNGNPKYKWGFVNKKGEEAVPLQYDAVNVHLENGLFAVGEETGEKKENGEEKYKWGFINEEGEEIVAPQYDDILRVSKEGMKVAIETGEKDEDGDSEYLYGYINSEGEEVFPPVYGYLAPSNNGNFIIAREADENFWKVLDKEGEDLGVESLDDYNVVTAPSDDGIIPVGRKIGEDEEGESLYLWGCIDLEGREILPVQYEVVWFSHTDDWILTAEKVEEEDGYSFYEYEYFDASGQSMLKLPAEYVAVEPFRKVKE